MTFDSLSSCQIFELTFVFYATNVAYNTDFNPENRQPYRLFMCFYFCQDEAMPPKHAPEEMSKGSVGFSVYTRFFAFGYGQIFLPIIFILAAGFQAAFLISDWWLAFW